MNIQELAAFLGLSNEELVQKAKELNIDLATSGELDEALITQLKTLLNIPAADTAEAPVASVETASAAEATPHAESAPVSNEEKGALRDDAEKKEPAQKKKKDEAVKTVKIDKSEKEKDAASKEGVEPEKKKGNPLSGVFGFFGNFFVPIFQTPIHRNLLIVGTILSASIAVGLSVLLQPKTAPVPVKTAEEIEKEKAPQINIRGGFRGEKDYFQLVWELHEQKYYQLAYQQAQKFLEEFHDSELLGDMYFKIGDILFDWDRGNPAKQYKESRIAYEKAMEYSPNDSKVPWALFQIGNTYFHLRLFQEASEYYRELLDTYPTYDKLDFAQSRLAICYLEMNQYDRAELEFKQFIELFPNSALKRNAQFKLAEIYYRKKEIKNSIEAYQRYLTMYPNSPKRVEVFFRVAKLYKYQKYYERAIEFFEKSIGEYPYDRFNDIAYYQIGECYMLLKQYEKARTSYQRLIETYPKSALTPVSVHRICDTLYQAGDVEGAIKAYEQALNSYPQATNARMSQVKLAELYYAQKQYDKAISVFSNILVDDPKFAMNDRVILRIAQSQFNKGNYLEAADWYLRLIREYPASPLIRKAYFDKAKSEEASKFYERAISSYLEFLSKFSDHPRIDLITYLTAETYFKLGKYMEAIGYWEDLRKKFPLSDYRFQALEQIGRTYLLMAQSDEYIPVLQKDYQVSGTVDEIKNSLELKGKEIYTEVLGNKALQGTEAYFQVGRGLVDYYIKNREMDKALEILKEIIPLYTGHEELYTLLLMKAKAYYELNATDDTVSAYEDLISLLSYRIAKADDAEKKKYNTIIADAYFSLGDLLYSQDKTSEALYLYLEGMKRLPEGEKRGWPLYQVANCFNTLGNYSKANYYYDKLKQDFPDEFWSEYVGWNKEKIKWKETMKAQGAKGTT